MILLYSICLLLFVSILLNILLIYKRKKHPLKTTQTQDAKMLLRDLLNSGAMLHVRILDAGDFFLKSPRG
jgi:hypothetical protein